MTSTEDGPFEKKANMDWCYNTKILAYLILNRL